MQNEISCFIGKEFQTPDIGLHQILIEDFEMITDFMDDDQDQPMNMDKQFKLILLEPLCQIDKVALRRLNDYFKLVSEFFGPQILKSYTQITDIMTMQETVSMASQAASAVVKVAQVEVQTDEDHKALISLLNGSSFGGFGVGGPFKNLPKPLSAIKLPTELPKKLLLNPSQDQLLIEKQKSSDSF